MDITKATTRQDRAACFHAIMQAVASELDGFIYSPIERSEPHNWLADCQLISGKIPATLYITLHLGDFNEKHPYRATAGGVYPRTAKGESYPSYGDPRPTINFQLTRTPAQIAADITRRLLPEYVAFFKKVANWIQASDAAAATLQATRDAMIDAGFTFPAHSQTEGYMQFAKGERLGEARPTCFVYGSSIDLKVKNLKPHEVRAVLEVLGLLPELAHV